MLERHVTAGLDAPVAVRRYSDAGALLGTWTLVSDRQGSTLGALDSLGAQIAAAQSVSRNPFGAVEGLAPAGSDAPVSGYTGAAQSVSNGGGMVYLRNRWYDPQSGRFLTQDPIGVAGGVNLYAYAGNDPIAYTDPFGLCPEWLDGKPCTVMFAAVTVSASWLTATVTGSVGSYESVIGGEKGNFYSYGLSNGVGTVPGPEDARNSLVPAKKSWLPSVSVTIESGEHESLSSFKGPGTQYHAGVTVGLATVGGSLSATTSGNGYTTTLGVASPGLPVSGGIARTHTFTWHEQPIAHPAPTMESIRAVTDATAVAQ